MATMVVSMLLAIERNQFWDRKCTNEPGHLAVSERKEAFKDKWAFVKMTH